MAARCGWLVAALPCLLLAGCGGGDDGIKTYRVAAPTDRGGGDENHGAGPAVPPANAPVKSRLLGAIIPAANGTSLFVKFSGPIEKIDANEKDFDAFLNSVRVPGEGGKPVSWAVPPGWVEGKARQMRLVTLQKPDGSAPDLYISEPFGGNLLSNVNRWRGEVGLKPVTEAELPGVTKEITLGTAKAYRVDFRGPGGKGGMGGPFSGGGGN